jgi:(E)-4-hydroxy-3-methylbut-2-enyl-diphosphate synthase
LFNIQDVLEKVKTRTGHLKGLKIAVMGCIVNGPGEMADADYGYVGAGKGKVMLYKGQELVKKHVDEAVALEELIKLIKENGDWKES